MLGTDVGFFENGDDVLPGLVGLLFECCREVAVWCETGSSRDVERAAGGASTASLYWPMWLATPMLWE